MILADSNLNFIQFSSKDSFNDNDKDGIANLKDYKNIDPQTAIGYYYTSNFNGTGKEINVTLHQSKIDIDSPLYEISNASDSTNNTFSAVCPTDSSYNSINTNITIDNIFAPNRTVEIELDIGSSKMLDSADYAFSFRVPGNGILENLSLCFTEYHSTYDDDAEISIDLLGSYDDSGTTKPYTKVADLITSYFIENDTAEVWHNFTNLDQFLDISASNVHDNTFFIQVTLENPAWCNLNILGDQDSGDPDGDNSEVYFYTDDYYWDGSDIAAVIDFEPPNNYPSPTEIGLEINGTGVDNGYQNSGNWTISDQFIALPTQLNYTISAGWWDVSCDITRIQVNYSKFLTADANFNVPNGGNSIEWNVTRSGGFTGFQTGFKHFYINYTIPTNWYDIEVWNGGTQKTNIITRDLGTGYNETRVMNAENGTFWHLKAKSANLLSSIDIYDMNSNLIKIANYTDKVSINASFSTLLDYSKGNAQDVNVSVYSPITISPNLNYTNTNQTNYYSNEIYLGDWTISDKPKQYGVFRVQVWWNNGTAAGFNETILTIYGETELQPTLPDDIFDASNTFDITLYFNDTEQNLPIEDAAINYSINGGDWRFENVTEDGIGQYRINIDCNDSDFYDSGVNSVMINASKHYYNNDTISVEFTILGETELTLVKEPDKPLYTSSETFNITAYYNNTVRNKGIDGATDLTVEIDYILYTDAIIFDNKDGNYNISIRCNATQFGQYGDVSIRVNISKTNYHNQTRELTVTIEGESSISSFSKYPNIQVYNSSDTFNITIFFNDTARNNGIDLAIINYSINGGVWRYDNVVEIGNGNYNITVNCSDNLFGQYEPATITVNASKIYFDNASVDVNIDIRGNTALQVTKAPKTSYSSKDIFNITVYFNDTARNTYITGAALTIEVNETIYNTYWEDLLNGFYNITINCSDSIFADKGYGDFIVRINSSKTYFYNKSTEVNFNVGAETDLTYSLFPDRYFFDSNELFNITVFYNDTAQNEGIDGATIIVEINGDVYDDFSPINYAKGLYNITINCSAIEFNDYGMATIKINASKPNFDDQEIFVIPNVQITGITELTIVSKVPDLAYYSSSGTFNITAYFYDTTRNQGINGSTIELYVGITPIGQIYVFDNGDGYYNISINCSDAVFYPYDIFTIRVDANKSNYYNQSKFTTAFIIGNTALTSISPAEKIEIYQGSFDIQIEFKDIEQDIGVPGATIEYTLNGTGYRSDAYIQEIGSGIYNITINVNDADFNNNYGFIDIRINASIYKYFNRSITFRIHRQILTNIDPNINPNLGSIFRSENISYTFNYNDTLNNPIIGADITLIGSNEGFTWLPIPEGNGYYTISLNSTGVVAQESAYTLQFRVNATGNQTQTITITIIVLLPKTEILDFTTNIIDNVVPEGFNLTLNFNFTDAFNNIGITDITSENVTVMQGGLLWSLIVNDTHGDYVNFPNGGWLLINHGDGNYTLNISTYKLVVGNSYTITITISYTASNPGLYNSSEIPIQFYYAYTPGVPVAPSDGDGGGRGKTVTGVAMEDIMFYIIIIGAVVGIAAAIVGVQKGVIAPKKRERERILREVTTVFDDAINLEHILVIYKGTGTCIFFKSYGMEEIDPELISGFLTAVSSFGREMDSQEALNEIKYGDKMLLLADGEFIRIALVLEKSASIILRQHLKEFIEAFEVDYANALPKWRGQINVFRDAGELVDDRLHTSIILPHEIKYDLGKVKSLKSPHSKDVLKVANSLVEGSDRKFFFIATLLIEAVDKTGKDKAEIFMGIKELRDSNLLVPIQLTAIEEQPISQQELNLINQKLQGIPGLAAEERQKLVNDVAKMRPAEREAYIASLAEQKEIISAPIKSKAGEVVIDNIKSAKKIVNNLRKKAKSEVKRKNMEKGIGIYREAAVIATNWDLTKEFENIEDEIRIITISDLKSKMKVLEAEAKLAAKAGDYAEAAEKYGLASDAASEVFKLGVTEMTKEVKRLTNKSKEFERLS